MSRLPEGGRPKHYTGKHRHYLTNLEVFGLYLILAGVTMFAMLGILLWIN